MTEIGEFHGFVNRGDPSAHDFELSQLPVSGAWADLDLSSIVPTNARAVLLRMHITASTVGAALNIRKKGSTYYVNLTQIYTQAADQPINYADICPVGPNGMLEYLKTDITWTAIHIAVKGWWI
jgi:hypothetical protein